MKANPFLLISASVSGLLAGCTVGPDYRAPDVIMPTAWSSSQPTAVHPATVPSAGNLSRWWTTFGDPTLDTLIVRAVEQNLDLKAASARVREARAARGIATADRLPTVNATGGYSRNLVSENGPLGPLVGGDEFDDFQVGFDAGWELDLFGRVRRNVEAANAQWAATVEGRRDVLVRLLADVARNYVELRAAQRRLTIATHNLAAQEDTLRLTRIRREAGTTGDFDVVRAESQMQQTQAILPTLRLQIRVLIYATSVLLGEQPASLERELIDHRPIPAALPSIPLGLPSDLLLRRPDIRGAERALIASNARIGVAEADLYPRFSLTGQFALDATKLSNLTDGGSQGFAFGPSFRWNLFDAGRTKSNVRGQEARDEQAVLRYRQVILGALQEVETALARYETEQARRQSLNAAVTASSRAVELAKIQYAEGSLDLVGVLDAQRSLYAAQDLLAQSDAQASSQLIAVYKSLGGGWEPPATSPTASAGRAGDGLASQISR
jgi:NodT family efflux transporter outer membrane factor (OMF) lipoprotein